LTSSEPLPPSLAPAASWWWRPPAFLSGFGLIVFGLYVAGNDVYKTRETEADRAALKEMSSRRVLLLGASHGRGLVLKEAGLDGVDLVHDGQDLFEVAYIARSVKAKAPKLDTVLITLSYFSFVADNAAYVQNGVQTRIGLRIGLYRGFGRLAFIPGDASHYAKAMLAPVVTPDHYRQVFQRLPAEVATVMREDEADEVDEAELDGVDDELRAKQARRRVQRRAIPRFFARHARGRCRFYARLTRVMQENHPRLARNTKQLMLNLTRELEAKSIRVIFFTPPYLRPFNECFDAPQQQLMRETGRWLESSTRARYFDFSTEPSFVDHERYFRDSDHLNNSGKLAFSRLFGKKLAAEARP
jgi:hypothetical protein